MVRRLVQIVGMFLSRRHPPTVRKGDFTKDSTPAFRSGLPESHPKKQDDFNRGKHAMHANPKNGWSHFLEFDGLKSTLTFLENAQLFYVNEKAP